MSAETRIEKNRSSSLISSGEREMIKSIWFMSTNFQDQRVMLMKKRFDKTSNQSSLILDKPRVGNQFKRLPCFSFVALLWFVLTVSGDRRDQQFTLQLEISSQSWFDHEGHAMLFDNHGLTEWDLTPSRREEKEQVRALFHVNHSMSQLHWARDSPIDSTLWIQKDCS